jgi:hypothetical protein
MDLAPKDLAALREKISEGWFGGVMVGQRCPVAIWLDPPAFSFINHPDLQSGTMCQKSAHGGYVAYHGGMIPPERLAEFPLIDEVMRKADEILWEIDQRNNGLGNRDRALEPTLCDEDEAMALPAVDGWEEGAWKQFDSKQWAVGFDMDNERVMLAHFGQPDFCMYGIECPPGKRPVGEGPFVRRGELVFSSVRPLLRSEGVGVGSLYFDLAWCVIHSMKIEVHSGAAGFLPLKPAEVLTVGMADEAVLRLAADSYADEMVEMMKESPEDAIAVIVTFDADDEFLRYRGSFPGCATAAEHQRYVALILETCAKRGLPSKAVRFIEARYAAWLSAKGLTHTLVTLQMWGYEYLVSQ